MSKTIKPFILAAVIILCVTTINAQQKISWTNDNEITKADFKGNTPEMAEDNLQQYLFSCTWEFNFQMASLQFTFSKNFNKYVDAYYLPQQSWIEEGELTDDLLLMANLDFDIAELFARRFRKEIYDNKRWDSSPQIFNEVHSKIQYDYVNYRAKIESEYRSKGNIEEVVTKYSKEVNDEILKLNEFCKTCKPKKKKRKKK